ncbi:hypothetical protein GCM10027578_09210 [Spirosoma luteolum]
MPAARQETVYSLLTVVFVLLLGIVALLWVAYNRHQHLADQTLELRRNLSEQKGQIDTLRDRLEKCNPDELLPTTDAPPVRRLLSPTDTAPMPADVEPGLAAPVELDASGWPVTNP